MKKLIGLLYFIFVLLYFSINGLAQTNATGTVIRNFSRPLGDYVIEVMYGGFTSPTLPSDAVITGIYPVILADGNGGAFQWAGYGASLPFDTGLVGSAFGIPGSTAFASQPFHPTSGGNPVSIGTSLSVLSTQNIDLQIYTSLFLNGLNWHLNTTGLGYAIYYTSSHPRISEQLPLPIPVGAGIGVAWSVPTTLTPSPAPYGQAFGSIGSPVPLCYDTMTGTVNLPNASSFNGTMTIQMLKNGVKNTANFPYLTVPTQQVQYRIVNGVPQGISNGSYVSNDCMSPRVPYYVEIADTTGTIVSSDNWYLPNSTPAAIDIGSMQEQKFNGPITVAIPQGIISTPQGNQTITQPAGTSLTINGTVNFTGTVAYTTPPAFTLIKATQVLVNGVTSSSFPLDVNGIINASTGFCVAGCSSATIGQVLLYNGTAFVPGTPTVTFPNLYYQTLSYNGSAAPQRGTLAFDPTSFAALIDSASATTVKLATVATAGNYSNVSGFTLDQFGRVSAVATSSVATIRGTLSIGGVVGPIGSNTCSVYSVTMSAAIPANHVVDLSWAQGSTGPNNSIHPFVQGVSGAVVQVNFCNDWNSPQGFGPGTVNLAVL